MISEGILIFSLELIPSYPASPDPKVYIFPSFVIKAEWRVPQHKFSIIYFFNYLFIYKLFYYYKTYNYFYD